ncbi:MAG: bifunctional glycosyltransferase/class I SAM-dependent methyltransferase [Planctomycetaceae bacterium]|nr:bifunctional glycosyltransferase/class I SAM-dependent methyltransferase [Planctomycetaceae bacterium]
MERITHPAVLSILIPVYNEQNYLARILERVIAAPVPENLQKEIVIVNDASKDRTPQVIRELCAKYPQIRAFDQPVNMGKGAAIRRAIREMTGQFAIIQDADLEYDPNDYARVLQPILDGHADVVYGSRFATREMRRIVHYHHKLGNLFLTHLSNWATGLDLTDMETCYKAFRSELVKSIPIRSNRFGIEPELTAKLAKRKAVFYEVPISYHGRRYDEGKKIGWKDGVSAVWTIFKYWLIDDCYDEKNCRSVLQSMNHVRKYTQWQVRLASKWFGSKILEIGSGIGNVSRCLPQRERLTLTDCDPEYVRILENHYDGNDTINVCKLDVHSEEDVQAVMEKSQGKSQYDTLVMFNVLEHLEKDGDALRRLKPLLQNHGKLILILPQHKWLYGAMDKAEGHYRRYTSQGVKNLLSQSGYRVVKLRSFNFMALFGWFVNSVLLRRKNAGKFQLKIFNTLVPVSAFFERWLPLPGANLLVVAEPQPQASAR